MANPYSNVSVVTIWFSLRGLLCLESTIRLLLLIPLIFGILGMVMIISYLVEKVGRLSVAVKGAKKCGAIRDGDI
jgi:hypothetical protein